MIHITIGKTTLIILLVFFLIWQVTNLIKNICELMDISTEEGK